MNNCHRNKGYVQSKNKLAVESQVFSKNLTLAKILNLLHIAIRRLVTARERKGAGATTVDWLNRRIQFNSTLAFRFLSIAEKRVLKTKPNQTKTKAKAKAKALTAGQL